MKSYNPKGPKSIAKSAKGIRALNEGDTFIQNWLEYITSKSHGQMITLQL